MMLPVAFFDTNVFVYTDDQDSPIKRAAAIDLIGKFQRSRSARISLQVLQEYFVVVTKKLRVDVQIAQPKVEVMSRLPVTLLTEQDVVAAIEFHRLHGISFWDSLILQAARVSGATVLFSEDMQSGSVWGGVRVINPFAADAPSLG